MSGEVLKLNCNQFFFGNVWTGLRFKRLAFVLFHFNGGGARISSITAVINFDIRSWNIYRSNICRVKIHLPSNKPFRSVGYCP